MQLWLASHDPNNNGTLNPDNVPLSTWYDKSGNGNDYAALGGARPTYLSTSSHKGGNPVIVFDGSNYQIYITLNLQLIQLHLLHLKEIVITIQL